MDQFNGKLYQVANRIVKRYHRAEGIRAAAIAIGYRIAQVATGIALITSIGCHVSGTIGGTTDLERKHDVSVSITFTGE